MTHGSTSHHSSDSYWCWKLMVSFVICEPPVDYPIIWIFCKGEVPFAEAERHNDTNNTQYSMFNFNFGIYIWGQITLVFSFLCHSFGYCHNDACPIPRDHCMSMPKIISGSRSPTEIILILNTVSAIRAQIAPVNNPINSRNAVEVSWNHYTDTVRDWTSVTVWYREYTAIYHVQDGAHPYQSVRVTSSPCVTTVLPSDPARLLCFTISWGPWSSALTLWPRTAGILFFRGF